MNYSVSKVLFYSILLISSLVSVSANTWLGAWMGLEINLLSFIPLMGDNNNLMASEASVKYFLTQALASSILLFGATLLIFSSAELIYASTFPELMLVSSLLMKSGAAPFHFWFPLVIEGLQWPTAIILMTWQKLAPLLLISYVLVNWMVLLCAALSAIIGSVGGLNQTSLRKLMAFSSISHLGWMLSALLISEILWSSYFLLYCLLSSAVAMSFWVGNLFQMNQLYSENFKKIFIVFSLNILSLGGLPPLLGFYPKWLVIQQLSENYSIVLVFLLVISSLITLYFYLRLCFSSFTTGKTEPLWFTKEFFYGNISFLLIFSSFLSISGLLMLSLFFLL